MESKFIDFPKDYVTKLKSLKSHCDKKSKQAENEVNKVKNQLTSYKQRVKEVRSEKKTSTKRNKTKELEKDWQKLKRKKGMFSALKYAYSDLVDDLGMLISTVDSLQTSVSIFKKTNVGIEADILKVQEEVTSNEENIKDQIGKLMGLGDKKIKPPERLKTTPINYTIDNLIADKSIKLDDPTIENELKKLELEVKTQKTT